MGKQQVNTGRGNQTINTNNVWDRIVALETNGVPNLSTELNGVKSQLAEKAKQTDLDTTNQTVSQKANQVDLSNVQSQVNSIVLNQSNGNVAEVIQARSDVKGFPYTTLKSHLDSLETGIKTGSFNLNFTWTQGNIDVATGSANDTTTYRIKTDFISLPMGEKIEIKPLNGFRYNIVAYDASKVYVKSLFGTWNSASSVLTVAYPYYRIVIDKGSTTITPTDAQNLVFTTKFDNAQLSALQTSAMNGQIDYTTTWVVGSIYSDTGGDYNITSRIRSDYMELPVGQTVYIFTNRNSIMYYGYDGNKTYVPGDSMTTFNSNRVIALQVKQPYYRFMVNATDAAVGTQLKFYIPLTDKSFKTVDLPTQDSVGDPLFSFVVGGMSDLTFVGNELWTFPPTGDNHVDYGFAYRYSVDFVNKTATQVGSFQVNFGHCNSVDYCNETDALIFGNGSSSYTQTGAFYIVENASNLKNLTQADINTVAIKIDCSSLPFGTEPKFNVVWGEGNFGNHDICYLMTTDNAKIRKLLLGKGATQLPYGTLNAGATGFNGTFAILREYNQFSLGAENAIQGSDYANGILYTGIGHDGIWYWENSLNTDSTTECKAKKQVIYQSDGTVKANTYSEGLSIKDDYLLLGMHDNGVNSIHVFKNK